MRFSDSLEQHRPTFIKHAESNGISEHVDLLMAITMQESGGRLSDIMQSSESLGLARNSLSTEMSIQQGVSYFAKVLEEAGGNVPLALQSYNFGSGFIAFAESRGGYSKEAAIDFSQMMYSRLQHQGIYSCISEEAELYQACYGDILYVDRVMNHLGEDVETFAITQAEGVGEVEYTQINGVHIDHYLTLGDVLIVVLLSMILIFQLLSRFIRS